MVKPTQSLAKPNCVPSSRSPPEMMLGRCTSWFHSTCCRSSPYLSSLLAADELGARQVELVARELVGAEAGVEDPAVVPGVVPVLDVGLGVVVRRATTEVVGQVGRILRLLLGSERPAGVLVGNLARDLGLEEQAAVHRPVPRQAVDAAGGLVERGHVLVAHRRQQEDAIDRRVDEGVGQAVLGAGLAVELDDRGEQLGADVEDLTVERLVALVGRDLAARQEEPGLVAHDRAAERRLDVDLVPRCARRAVEHDEVGRQLHRLGLARSPGRGRC